MTNNKVYIFFSGQEFLNTSNGAIDYTEKGEFLCQKKRVDFQNNSLFFIFSLSID
jgi:hypothetical protein